MNGDRQHTSACLADSRAAHVTCNKAHTCLPLLLVRRRARRARRSRSRQCMMSHCSCSVLSKLRSVLKQLPGKLLQLTQSCKLFDKCVAWAVVHAWQGKGLCVCHVGCDSFVQPLQGPCVPGYEGTCAAVALLPRCRCMRCARRQQSEHVPQRHRLGASCTNTLCRWPMCTMCPSQTSRARQALQMNLQAAHRSCKMWIPW